MQATTNGTVDLANRILSQQPSNVTALDYRQKAEEQPDLRRRA
ncbi:MAG: hypothetical protein U0694_16590 [Anaerolineae bacterium]